MTTIGKGGSKQIVMSNHAAEKKYFTQNPDTTTWALGGTYKIAYKIDKKGKYPAVQMQEFFIQ